MRSCSSSSFGNLSGVSPLLRAIRRRRTYIGPKTEVSKGSYGERGKVLQHGCCDIDDRFQTRIPRRWKKVRSCRNHHQTRYFRPVDSVSITTTWICRKSHVTEIIDDNWAIGVDWLIHLIILGNIGILDVLSWVLFGLWIVIFIDGVWVFIGLDIRFTTPPSRMAGIARHGIFHVSLFGCRCVVSRHFTLLLRLLVFWTGVCVSGLVLCHRCLIFGRRIAWTSEVMAGRQWQVHLFITHANMTGLSDSLLDIPNWVFLTSGAETAGERMMCSQLDDLCFLVLFFLFGFQSSTELTICSSRAGLQSTFGHFRVLWSSCS